MSSRVQTGHQKSALQRFRVPARVLLLLGLVGCRAAPVDEVDRVDAGQVPHESQATAGSAVDDLDLTNMEPQVKARLLETRSAALANPRSADAWGRYGMVAHAHELWEQAASAYRQARRLDPNDPRWPYYLGDVLSVQGTELDEAVAAFREAMRLQPDYAPAHMRLGNVLIALDRGAEAAVELERALELAPDLQPARVALAQVRLSEGRLEESERLLDQVLAVEPKHGQALSTLGRVYMRQARRDEARETAARARNAATYNLYSDPLMGQVVAEGVSTVQIWERAKGFLEKGNYEQAAIGLRRVVMLQPDNASAHLQLAVTYGNLGDFERSRYHLERTVSLDPELVEPRMDLGQILLDLGRAGEALEHLRTAAELDPGRAGLGWLLGRALVETGELEAALGIFESAQRSATEVPAWAHKSWGRAQAQTGDPRGALLHFQNALESEPADAEALFYQGLVFEGLGRHEEAIASYCRSIASQPDSPASGRLDALGRTCSGS